MMSRSRGGKGKKEEQDSESALVGLAPLLLHPFGVLHLLFSCRTHDSLGIRGRLRMQFWEKRFVGCLHTTYISAPARSFSPMNTMPGSVGTSAGLLLRLGQALFSIASLFFMSVGVEFYSYTAFCFLVTIMGLLIPWSATLAMFDMYSIWVGSNIRLPGVMMIIVLGDLSLSMLSLAAACASAAVVDLLVHSRGGNYCPPKYCGRYQLSAAMAFLSWVLTAASSLLNLWLMASR